MSVYELDAVDKGILHLLQQDARNITPVDMAEKLPVSDGTVRNRIEQMESNGVIEGYVPKLDYERAGFTLEVVFTCTAPFDKQKELAEAAIETHRVVNVREMFASEGNVQVVAVATNLDDVMSIAKNLAELGFRIDAQRLTLSERVRPFNHFGENVADN